MSPKSPFQIEIPRRASVCVHCSEPLLKGSEYYSTLVEGVKEGTYERRDYCARCALKLIEEKAFGEVRSLWKASIPARKEASDLPKEREAQAIILLKEALASKDPHAPSQAFVLALYLARRRRIILRQEIKLENGHVGLIYELAETEEMLCVGKISLADLKVEAIQGELAKKFSGK